MGKQRKNRESTGGLKLALIYARVSTKEQEEGFSVDAQLALLRDYAHRTGFTVVEEIIEAESARGTGRPGFNRLVRVITDNRHYEIIVEKTDRLYRNLKDRVTIDEIGCCLHFVKENTVLTKDSRSHDKFIHDIKVVIAKNYCDNLSEEARKGMREKAKQGIYPSMAPIGYLNVREGSRSIIVPDPDRASLVRHVFEQYATGSHSLRSIAQLCFDIGLRTRKGRRIPGCSVAWMFDNPIYYGIVRWDDQHFVGTHDPIISKAVFDTVQTIMHGRSGGNSGYGTKEFTYKGVFACGHCGCQMTAEIKKGIYVYYHCTGQRGRCPGQKNVRESAITDQLVGMLHGLEIDSEIYGWLVEALRGSFIEERKAHDEHLAALRAEEAVLERKLREIYIDKVNGVIALGTYKQFKEEWEKELADIQVLIRDTDRSERSYFEEGVGMLELASNAHLRFKEADSEQKRTLLRNLGSNFLLLDGKVHVQLRKPFHIILKANLEKVGLDRENGENGIWWAQLDSN